MKVHKGDTVLVVSGKDKGAKGKVIRAYPARNKILVEGVNRIKKHTAVSSNERGASSGGIVTQEAPIHPNIKQKYVENDERGTNLIFRNLHNTARVGKNGVSDEVVRRLREPGAKFEDVAELAAELGAKR